MKHKYIYTFFRFCPVHKNKQGVMGGSIPTNDDAAKQKDKQPTTEGDEWRWDAATL